MNQLKKLLVVWYLLFGTITGSVSLFAAFEFQGVGWASAAANIRVVGDPHPDRHVLNPALLSRDVVPRAGFQYFNPFSGLDIHAGSMTVQTRIGKLPMIGGLSYFGDDKYSELMLTTGTSWALSQQFRTGMSLNLFQLNITDIATQLAMSVSISTNLKLAEDLQIGSVLQHIVQHGKGLTVPQRFHFGVEYDGGQVVLLFALEQEAALPLELNVALLTSSQRHWQLAVGYRDLSQTVSAGWRLEYKNIGMHYSTVMHPDLPLSHGFGLELLFP
ncbi:MAG: hypothetical protein U9Q77_09790 [Candidatus Marinimicrobia bacterium]|nr:hypothetical protein [Candidatus Neomarinimicrobiota bacterium]